MMSRKQIVIVISDVDKALAFEWIARDLADAFNLTFVLLNKSGSRLEDYLKINGHAFRRITVSGKRSFPKAFFQLFWFFIKRRPHLVHAHLLTAQILALPAAFMAGVKRRVYTRHTSDFHHKYHRKGILYDRLSNRFATTVVSISQATRYVLRELEGVPDSKIETIHHGFDFSSFVEVDEERILRIRSKYNIQQRPVIGVIARHIEWKGVQYIVPAFERLLKEEPEAILVLANAQGPYHSAILDLLAEVPQKNVRLIHFEEDSGALYKCFDVYVHTPVDAICEAFGQTYVEALACGVPSVFTLSGVASEFVKDGVHACVVNFRDSESVYTAMIRLLRDTQLRRQAVDNGQAYALENFALQGMIEKLRTLYDE